MSQILGLNRAGSGRNHGVSVEPYYITNTKQATLPYLDAHSIRPKTTAVR